MQNRYAGDVGDFGKFGLLRKLENTGLKVGVNWYLVADEGHNQDGKHIGYQKNKAFQGCDDELLFALNRMLEQGYRTIAEVESLHLLNSGVYYSDELTPPSKENPDFRTKWLAASLDYFADCDLVFLDPDNGMRPKSVGPYSWKSIKYVTAEEILAYYNKGYSVMFYSHRTREKLDVYLRRFDDLFSDVALSNATIKGVSFKRGTTRDYFFILHEEHVKKVEKCLDDFLHGNWGRHFEEIKLGAIDNGETVELAEEPDKATIRPKRKLTQTTRPGYINKNNQKNLGRTDMPGTDYGQWFYEMACLNCGYRYYANGSDIWQRKCPKCQGGTKSK